MLRSIKCSFRVQIRSISPLDPSGWVSVSLDRDPNKPLAPVEPIKNLKPPAAAGPANTASNIPAAAEPAAVGQR